MAFIAWEKRQRPAPNIVARPSEMCYDSSCCGEVPKRPKGVDSKSTRRRKACVGSNPTLSATIRHYETSGSDEEPLLIYFNRNASRSREKRKNPLRGSPGDKNGSRSRCQRCCHCMRLTGNVRFAVSRIPALRSNGPLFPGPLCYRHRVFGTTLRSYSVRYRPSFGCCLHGFNGTTPLCLSPKYRMSPRPVRYTSIYP